MQGCPGMGVGEQTREVGGHLGRRGVGEERDCCMIAGDAVNCQGGWGGQVLVHVHMCCLCFGQLSGITAPQIF